MESERGTDEEREKEEKNYEWDRISIYKTDK